MKFSLINNENVIVAIIEADTYALAKQHKDYNENWILIQSEEHHVKGLDLNTYKPLTNKEKIKKGLITLAENQVYDEKSDVIFTLSEDQEYRDGEVVVLSKLEQYKKGIISEEEFTAVVNGERELAYKEQTDSQILDLMRSFLNNNKDKLTKEQKAILDDVNKKVKAIKAENSKE